MACEQVVAMDGKVYIHNLVQVLRVLMQLLIIVMLLIHKDMLLKSIHLVRHLRRLNVLQWDVLRTKQLHWVK
jgi:hypothetical protein